MIRLNRTHRQWKSAVDEAVGPARFAEERDRSAAEVAKKVWMANGGREWDDARTEGSLLALEALVMPHLNEDIVRSLLALRYLAVLGDSLRTADYEDAPALNAQTRWAEQYLKLSLECGLIAPAKNVGYGAPDDTVASLKDRIHGALAAAVQRDLKAAEVAA